MFKLKVTAVGKLKEAWWREAAAEYQKRLGPSCRLDIKEVAAEPLTTTVAPQEAMRREGERLLAQIKDDELVVVLDRTGTKLTSEAFAELLRELGGGGQPLNFVIGGAAGLHESVTRRAGRRLSFSDMTLTHEMARILLLEQIYRAMTILEGKKYHL